jgi:uracil-DNA glycosylase family 4
MAPLGKDSGFGTRPFPPVGRHPPLSQAEGAFRRRIGEGARARIPTFLRGDPVRTRSLTEAKSQARTCRECSLWKDRTLVYDNGCHDADLMFIGEAPGRQEDEQGKPFVGDAGELLNTMLCEIAIRRDDVYIANVIKHRPPRNRDPYASEIKACLPWLVEQILLVDPKLIVPLGNVAMRRFRDGKDKIGDVRGKCSVWKGRRIIPTYHPSYVGRFPKKMHDYREDFATIRAALDALNDGTEPC